MVKIKLVGIVPNTVGKSLWEIIGNLSDYGIGRLITRGTWCKNYPEPSFFKIVKVQPALGEENPYKNRKCSVFVDSIFRGNRIPTLHEIWYYSYRTDYQLIPKDEEELWYKRLAECKPRERIIDTKYPLPPVLNLIVAKEKASKNEPFPDDFKVEAPIRQHYRNIARPAKDGEIPDVKLSDVSVKPVNPKLYENIEFCRPYFVNPEKMPKSYKHRWT